MIRPDKLLNRVYNILKGVIFMIHSTSKNGDIGVAKAMADLLQKGYDVLMPVSNTSPFDLVIYNGIKFFKIQVKYRSINKQGILSIECRRAINNRKTLIYRKMKDSEVDIYCIYCPETDKCYYVIYKNIKKDSIHLRIEPPKKGQKKNIMLAKHFEMLDI